MLFPEDLDNKTFRLFVQRTVYLMGTKATLTSIERQLANIIEEHPEVGLYIDNNAIDINEHFPDNEYNPFLNLAALWEVEKQISNDNPKGLIDTVLSAFPANSSKSEIRAKLSLMYLDLFRQGKNGTELSSQRYLKELQKMIQDPLYFEHLSQMEQIDSESEKDAFFNEYYSNALDKAFNHFQGKMYEQVGEGKISPTSKLFVCLNKLPSEWVNATVMFWNRPAMKLKRDRAGDISSFLLNEDNRDEIFSQLKQDELGLLKTFVDNDGVIKYKELTRKFGNEENESYWWTERPPRSLIGRLRYKGMLFIGVTTIKSRNYKIGLVPKDLLSILEINL